MCSSQAEPTGWWNTELRGYVSFVRTIWAHLEFTVSYDLHTNHSHECLPYPLLVLLTFNPKCKVHAYSCYILILLGLAPNSKILSFTIHIVI